jgi:hypothetical protein
LVNGGRKNPPHDSDAGKTGKYDQPSPAGPAHSGSQPEPTSSVPGKANPEKHQGDKQETAPGGNHSAKTKPESPPGSLPRIVDTGDKTLPEAKPLCDQCSEDDSRIDIAIRLNDATLKHVLGLDEVNALLQKDKLALHIHADQVRTITPDNKKPETITETIEVIASQKVFEVCLENKNTLFFKINDSNLFEKYCRANCVIEVKQNERSSFHSLAKPKPAPPYEFKRRGEDLVLEIRKDDPFSQTMNASVIWIDGIALRHNDTNYLIRTTFVPDNGKWTWKAKTPELFDRSRIEIQLAFNGSTGLWTLKVTDKPDNEIAYRNYLRTLVVKSAMAAKSTPLISESERLKTLLETLRKNTPVLGLHECATFDLDALAKKLLGPTGDEIKNYEKMRFKMNEGPDIKAWLKTDNPRERCKEWYTNPILDPKGQYDVSKHSKLSGLSFEVWRCMDGVCQVKVLDFEAKAP